MDFSHIEYNFRPRKQLEVGPVEFTDIFVMIRMLPVDDGLILNTVRGTTHACEIPSCSLAGWPSKTGWCRIPASSTWKRGQEWLDYSLLCIEQLMINFQ